MSIVSLFIDQNHFGISYYDNKSEMIFCSQVVIIPKDKQEILQILNELDEINILIFPSNQSYELIQFIKDQYYEQKGKALCIQRILSVEFTFDSSINKLLDLDFTFHQIPKNQMIDENLSFKDGGIQPEQFKFNSYQNNNQIDQQKYDILNQIIDVDKKSMVRSLGGLLCSLVNNQKISRRFSIYNIKFLKNTQKRVNFNTSTLNYLSIFKDEIHPSMIKGKGRTKEGFSIFMLFSKFIYTKLGMQKLQHLFQTPTFDIQILKKLNQRLFQFQQIYQLSQNYLYLIKNQYFIFNILNRKEINQQASFIKRILKGLKQLNSIYPNILNKLRDVTMNFDDWHRLKITLESSLKLMFQFLEYTEINSNENVQENITFFENLSQSSFEVLSKLNQFLDEYLEFSLQQGEITIRPGIVPELDELLKIYESLEEILDYYSNQEFSRLKDSGSEFKSQMMIQYFSQLGFFVTIEKDTKYEIQSGKKQSLSKSDIHQEDIQNSNDYSQTLRNQATCKQDEEFYSTYIKSEQSDKEESLINSSQKNKKIEQTGQQTNEDYVLDDQGYSNQKQSSNQQDQDDIKIDNVQLIAQYGLLDDYQFCFSLQDALLFKNDLCVYLDEKYGDIQSRIVDIQRDILREIESQILLCSEELIQAYKFIGDLDLYFCLFQSAEVYNLRRPQLTEDSVLLLYEMRNILTEISVGEKQFKSNNFSVYNYSDNELDQSIKSKTILNNQHSNRFTFITGPNYSGKSVLLKTVGMVCYLAHIGSFVPCRFSKIGMIDGIYTTSTLHDSVLKFSGETAKQQSTLNHILTQATNQSLILIDEFGKNLRLNESLLMNYSLIKCLTQDDFSNEQRSHYDNVLNINHSVERYNNNDSLQGNNDKFVLENYKNQYNLIPITLIASHLNQLFNYSDFQENYIIRFAHMEVLIEDGKNVYKISEIKKELSSSQKIVHIYQLNQGLTNNSCAALVVKGIVGKNDTLISRIFEINNAIMKGLLKINPRVNLELIHLKKAKKVIEYLTKSKAQN